MQILNQISSITSSNNIQFLVIGGHAINALGFSRQTGDIDLLVSKEDRDYWLNLMDQLNYKQFQHHEVFGRFESDEIASWPIDLMFVEKKVFQQLVSSSSKYYFGDCKCHVPSATHMISLKLHALKQRQAHREGKDIVDIQEILKLNLIDSEELRQLCERYDRIDLYEQFQKYTK